MKKINCIFIILSYVYLAFSMGLHRDLSNMKNVRIVNYSGECRFCKTTVDFANSVYSFIECNMSPSDLSQKYDIEKGKSDSVFSYKIINSQSKSNVIQVYQSKETEFFIMPNDNSSYTIISANENLCLTNPYSVNSFPYHISPNLSNISMLFTACTLVPGNKSQEFYFEQVIPPSTFKGKINLYYRYTNNLLTQTDINSINSEYPNYRFFFSDMSKAFIPYASQFDVEVPINELPYYLGSNSQTLLNNPNANCVYESSIRGNNVYKTPFYNDLKCQQNTIFSIDYTIEKLNKVNFNVKNTVKNTYLTTQFLTDNSEIVFTNSTNGRIFRFNVNNSNFDTFIMFLSYGNYTVAVTIKPNINIDFYEGLSFTIDSCNYYLFSIPIKEKINYARFEILEQTKNTYITSSVFADNSNITFSNSTNGQTYTYNVQTLNESFFNLWIHFGNYSTTVVLKNSFNFEYNGFNFSLNVYTPVTYIIPVKEKINNARFEILNTTKNTFTNTSIFANNSNITFSNSTNGQTYTFNVATLNTTFFNLWIHFGNYSTSLSIKDNNYYEFNGFTFSLNQYSAITYIIPVKEKIVSTNFQILETFYNSLINTGVFENNSIITFSNSTTGENFTFNVGSSNFNSFSIWLRFGNYTTSVTIKNTNLHEFISCNFTISTYSSTTQNILVKEKAKYVEFEVLLQPSNNLFNTSVFISNIIFTNTTLSRNYTYSIGSPVSSFSQILNFGSYSRSNISFTTHFNYEYVSGLDFSITDYNTQKISMIFKERKKSVTFVIKNQNGANLTTDRINGNITFSNSSNNANYVYNKVGGQNSFSIDLFFGNYSTSLSTSNTATHSYTFGSCNFSFFDYNSMTVTITLQEISLCNQPSGPDSIEYNSNPFNMVSLRDLSNANVICQDGYGLNKIYFSGSMSAFIVSWRCRKISNYNCNRTYYSTGFNEIGGFHYLNRHNTECLGASVLSQWAIEPDPNNANNFRINFSCSESNSLTCGGDYTTPLGPKPTWNLDNLLNWGYDNSGKYLQKIIVNGHWDPFGKWFLIRDCS